MGPLSAVLVGMNFFMKGRRKTKDYAESAASKASLPWWVKNIELLVAIAAAYILATATFKLYAFLLGSSPFKTLSGPSAVYVVMGIGSIILPAALLVANAFSWAFPVLRRANERAFRGHQVSFGTANLGLIKFAMVSVPIGVIALWAAAVQPWQ